MKTIKVKTTPIKEDELKEAYDKLGIEIFEALFKVEIKGIQEGKAIKEKELMNKGTFTTSMNRKVCYDAGYEKAREEFEKVLDIFQDDSIYTGRIVKFEIKNRLKQSLKKGDDL